MKDKFIIVSLFVFLCSISTYSQNYYWNNGEKVFVKKSSHKNYYLFSRADGIKQDLPVRSAKVFKNDFHWALGSIKEDNSVEYISPAVINPNGDTLNFSNLFYVKLKNEKDITQLEKMANENSIEILGNNEFMPLWHTLSCSKKSTGNALEMANLFHESKLFIVAEADFLIQYKTDCVNDPLFTNNKQWNLRNIGQNGGTSGVDINYCAARSITTSNPSIIVAVVDEGIQANHPDMINVLYSYNAESGISPSNSLYGSHGTQCAGIIGANANNNTGIAGIAPNCRLMSISHPLDSIASVNKQQQLANGINWAYSNGASIISNSWSISIIGFNSNFINNAITNALQNGRNGKGCVVVFSSGNNNSSVNYPTNSNPDIIAVGAINRKGNRATWFGRGGSNYGPELDIVAPGDSVPTTTIGSLYDTIFGGTSAAAPHVAGVAALMLSVNPLLTQKQVADIIESTAQKVRQDIYTYSNITDRPNGTWNNQLGYGLLDAGAAVSRANCWRNIHDITISAPRPQDVGCVVDIQNTTVTSTGALNVMATEKIIIGPGFNAQAGATLNFHIQ